MDKEQRRQEYLKWNKQRVKIRNFVARKPEIDKSCCICGKPGKILHNRQDPYYIAFICDECRKIPENLQLAEERRFDIRTKMDKTKLSIHNFTDEMVVRIIVGYMNSDKSMGDYCEEVGISRYQFNQLQDYYDKLFPSQNIKQLIKDKCVSARTDRIRESWGKRLQK